MSLIFGTNGAPYWIARILVDEIVPFYGVPECLLSNRGTNLLSHLMWDFCQMLGIKKLNTTAYHPECDGMAERLSLTVRSSPFYANTQPVLGSNGTDTYVEYCTPTGTHLMTARERSPHTCSLVLTYGLPLKQLIFHPQNKPGLHLKTIGKELS